MSVFTQYRFWSPVLGCEAVRLSMVDGRGGEYWRIIEAGSAKDFRVRRDAALDEIESAVARGDEPGEVG